MEDLLAAKPPAGDAAREMEEIVAGLAGRRFSTPAGAARRAMGLLMAKWRGYVDGAAAARRLAERLGQVRP